MAERLLTADGEFIEEVVDSYIHSQVKDSNASGLLLRSEKCPLLTKGICPFKRHRIPNCRACNSGKFTFDHVEDLIKQRLPGIQIRRSGDLDMDEVTSRGQLLKSRERGSLRLSQGGPEGTMWAVIKPLDFLKE